MVYQDVFTYVNTVSQSYISANASAVSQAIAPAATALLSIYVILWGAASMRGLIQVPITDAAVRILKIVFICTIALQLGHYNEVIVNTFFNGPEDLARALTGATDHATQISGLDKILDAGFIVGKQFWEKGGIISGDFGMYIIAVIVWGVVIAVTAYIAFLIVLAKIALSLVIALGPIFIISLLFQPTAGFFTAWVHQLANYGLLIVLVTGAGIFVVSLFEAASTGAVAVAGSTQIDQIFPLVITGIICVLVIAQLPSVASGLAGGLSLSSLGAGRLGLAVLASPAKYAARSVASRAARRERKEPRDPNSRYPAYENRDQQNSIGQ